MGRMVRWGCRASLRYTHLRMGKRDLGHWRRILGNGEHHYQAISKSDFCIFMDFMDYNP